MRFVTSVVYMQVVCIAWGLGTFGCEGCGCSEEGLIATLVSSTGDVERDNAKNLEDWKSAAKEARFFLGDGIRTKRESGAILGMTGGAQLHVKESTKIRFMNKPPKPGELGMEVESGEAELVAGAKDLEVILSDADTAVVHSGSRVRLKKNKTGIDLQVKIGKTDLLQMGKKAEELVAGQSLQIEIGALELVNISDSDLETADTDTDTGTGTSSEKESVDEEGSVQVEVLGKGARMRRQGEQSWSDLDAGSGAVAPHATISLPKKAKVKVNREGERVTLVGAGEFTIGGSDEPLVQTGHGKVLIDSAEKTVTVIVPGGRIVTASESGKTSQADINTKKDGTDVKVNSGTIEVHTDEGIEQLESGERTTIERPKKSSKQNQEYNFGSGPDFADFRVSAGDSFVVHLSKPPVVVGFQVGDRCQGDSLITIERKRGGTRGSGVVNVELPRGKSNYRVRCLDSDGAPKKETVAKGRVLVLKDSGRSRLPRKAPRSLVDMDGRSYKISYQNRLPIVKVRWPKAPTANSYTLAAVTSTGKRRSFKSAKPEYTFTSGSLSEGSHNLLFRASGTEKYSKTTTVQIRFDNAAPKASLMEPEEGGFAAGQTLSISGIALPGWSVSVVGGQVSVDDSYRFKGEVQFGGKYRGVALRLSKPGRGVHYYFRRGLNDG